RVEQGVPPPPNLTLEHLIPQSWDAKLYALDNTADDPAAWRRSHLHKLGNLTLTSGPMNASLSNGPWHAPGLKQDKQRLLRESALLINHRVANEHPKSFDDAAVDARGEALAEAIVAIWPGPPDDSEAPRVIDDESPAAARDTPRADAASGTRPGTQLTLIPRGTTFGSKLEFEHVLRRWY